MSVYLKKKMPQTILFTYSTLCANIDCLLKTLIMSACITDVADGNMRSINRKIFFYNLFKKKKTFSFS